MLSSAARTRLKSVTVFHMEIRHEIDKSQII